MVGALGNCGDIQEHGVFGCREASPFFLRKGGPEAPNPNGIPTRAPVVSRMLMDATGSEAARPD